MLCRIGKQTIGQKKEVLGSDGRKESKVNLEIRTALLFKCTEVGINSIKRWDTEVIDRIGQKKLLIFINGSQFKDLKFIFKVTLQPPNLSKYIFMNL